MAQTRPEPRPAKGQLLVRVACASLNRADFAKESPATRGKIAGSDVAGTVVEVGEGVAGFAVGDAVAGVTPGLAGGCAEFAVVDSKWATRVPAGISTEEAAAFPSSATTAWAGVKRLGDVAGKEVLVIGASGGVGQYAVLLLAAKGARVTAACGARNLEAALDLGAYRAVDYTQGYASLPDGCFDAAVGVNGKLADREVARLLSPGAMFALLGTSFLRPDMLTLPLRGHSLKIGLFFREIGRGGLEEAADVLASSDNHPNLQVIDGIEKAARMLPEIAREHPRGKVVVRV